MYGIINNFKNMSEFLGEGITFSDSEGLFLVYNPKMQEITGFSQEEANNSGDFTKLIYPDPLERQAALQRLQQILAHKEAFPLEVETTIRAKDGAKKVLLVSTVRMRFGDRDMFLSIYHDITQRKQQEEEVKKNKEKLEVQAWGLERTNIGIKYLYKELEEKTIELGRLNQELMDLSLKDAHTGIYNYRYLLDRMTYELNRARRHILPLSILMIDIDYFKLFNDIYGHQYGDIILKEFAQYLNSFCRVPDIVFRYGGEEFAILLPNANKTEAIQFAERLLKAIREHLFGPEGNKVKIKISIGVASFPEDGERTGSLDGFIETADKALLRTKDTGGDRLSTLDDANCAIDEIMAPNKENSIDKLRKKLDKMSNRANQYLLESILIFAKAIDVKDYGMRGHAEGMIPIVAEIGNKIGLSDREIEIIKQATLLHDLGKIGMPDIVIQKPDRLTKEEFEIIKRHPQIGADIIGSLHFLKDLTPIILHHHEKFDGSGYPAGLKDIEIPVGARIVCVADVYQALISDRPYRKAYSKQKAREIIQQGSGAHFDPDIVKIFIN